jgi:hypothetical protein
MSPELFQESQRVFVIPRGGNLEAAISATQQALFHTSSLRREVL